jgi:hypothetical protein
MKVNPPSCFSAIREGWTKEDWIETRDECAAVFEFDQGQVRSRATELATAATFRKYGPCPWKPRSKQHIGDVS